MVKNGDFSSTRGWNTGTGWSLAGNEATHTPGTASGVFRDADIANNATYRYGFDVDDRSAGSVTPSLGGGSTASGTAFSSNGQALGSILNPPGAGNDVVAIGASSSFNGTVDNFVVYRETAACIDQGEWFYWLEPQNGIGLPGPLAGPFSAIII